MTLRASPDILKVAIDESNRLQARLRANPDFQPLETMQHVIKLYCERGESPDRGDPIVDFSRPERSSTAKGPSSAIKHPKPKPTTNALPPPVTSLAPETQTKSYCSGWQKRGFAGDADQGCGACLFEEDRQTHKRPGDYQGDLSSRCRGSRKKACVSRFQCSQVFCGF